MTENRIPSPAVPEEPAKTPRWRFIPDTLIYLAIFLFSQLLVSLLLCLPYSMALISGELTENVSINEATQILTEKLYSEFLPVYTPIISIASTVIGLGALWLILRKTDPPALKNAGFTKPEKNTVIYSLPLALALQIFFSILLGAILAMPGMEDTLRQMNDYSSALEGPDKILSAVALVIAAPLNEELFFRGAIMRSMEKSSLNPFAAVIIQALLFGVFHELPIRIFYATLLGVILGIVRIKSRSIVPCLVLHALFNCCAYWEEAFSDETASLILSSAPVQIALFVFSALIITSCLILLFRKKEQDPEAQDEA
ncbi:MAG: CPBP family intramembrane metalloprotease [Clostridia bacterium]|nr:CPBP family intramembrane metalloprotease [Clostridia bacterium]